MIILAVSGYLRGVDAGVCGFRSGWSSMSREGARKSEKSDQKGDSSIATPVPTEGVA